MAATSATTAATGGSILTQQGSKRQEALAGYAFMAPAMIILIGFMIVPLLVALYFSFTNWNGIRPLTNPDSYQFIGLQNYQNLLISGRRVAEFYTAVKNTVYYVIGVVPTQTIIALVLAVIVNQRWLRGRGLFRTAFYFPSITSSVVISLIFVFLFTKGGPVNGFLQAIFPNYSPVTWLDDPNGIIHNFLGLFGVTKDTAGAWAQTQVFNISLWDWISGPSVTMMMVMMLAIWTTIGTMMVIYLAALQNIPTQVFEAAQVDGATAWQTFRYITLPMLRPTTFFVITIGLIGTFQVFDQVYVISKGKPQDTTLTIAYLVYRNAFDPSRPLMGLASATAIVLFIIIFVFTLLQRRVTGSDQANT
jgi:multiple sugar transport system permease protein